MTGDPTLHSVFLDERTLNDRQALRRHRRRRRIAGVRLPVASAARLFAIIVFET